MKTYYLDTPFEIEKIAELNAGDIVYLCGKIFTARDMAHLKLKKLFDEKKSFDEDLKGSAVFHAGPIVSRTSGSDNYKLLAIGPTTSIRMEPYSDFIGGLGVKAIIGKGGMGKSTARAMKKYGMVYLLAAHGCAAIHTENISRVDKQYWMDEIGMPEAFWVMECINFGPLIVGIDSKGTNLFEETIENSKKMIEAWYPEKESLQV